MTKMTKILIGITALVLCVAGLLSIGSNVMTATKGEKIAEYANPQKALFVIDVQEDYTGTMAKPPFPYKNSDRLIAKVNNLIDRAHKKNVPVIYIKQEFDDWTGKMFSKILLGGTAIKGTPGAAIDKRIAIVTDYLFSKPKPDAFSNPALDRFLNSHQINELYIVGLDAEFCVYLTAKGAINRGYNVSIITDSILLLAEEKWYDLLKKYNKAGINLIMSSGFLKDA